MVVVMAMMIKIKPVSVGGMAFFNNKETGSSVNRWLHAVSGSRLLLLLLRLPLVLAPPPALDFLLASRHVTWFGERLVSGSTVIGASPGLGDASSFGLARFRRQSIKAGPSNETRRVAVALLRWP